MASMIIIPGQDVEKDTYFDAEKPTVELHDQLVEEGLSDLNKLPSIKQRPSDIKLAEVRNLIGSDVAQELLHLVDEVDRLMSHSRYILDRIAVLYASERTKCNPSAQKMLSDVEKTMRVFVDEQGAVHEKTQ